MNDNPSRPKLRRPLLWLFGGLALATFAGVGAFLWWFFRGDAPEEVSLAAAIEANADDLSGAAPTTPASTEIRVEPSPTTSSTTLSTTMPPPAAGSEQQADTTAPSRGASPLDGTWTVDTSIGTFDYETASGSFAGFRVDEQIEGIGSNTAVGRTGDVTGSLEIDGTVVTATRVDVDLSTLTTNDSRRDGRIPGILRTEEHPTASFELVESIDFGDEAAGGAAVAVVAVGQVTIAGVTNTVEFDLEAQFVDDVIVVVASAPVVFSEFGIDAPSNPPLLQADDDGVIELQLLFRQDDSSLAVPQVVEP